MLIVGILVKHIAIVAEARKTKIANEQIEALAKCGAAAMLRAKT